MAFTLSCCEFQKGTSWRLFKPPPPEKYLCCEGGGVGKGGEGYRGAGRCLTCGYLLSVWLLCQLQGLMRRFEVKLLQSYKVFAIESNRKSRAL